MIIQHWMAFEISFAEDSIMFLQVNAFPQIFSSGCDNVEATGLILLQNTVR